MPKNVIASFHSDERNCERISVVNFFGQLCIKARFHYEREKDYFLFVLLIFLLCLALALILSTERSIKERKNSLFHACSGNAL